MEKEFLHKFYISTTEAWQAMYQEVLGAYKSIYWEVYSFVDDETGNSFVDLLCQKSLQGVDVKIIVDGFGSRSLSQIAINRLTGCGVEVLFFNTMRLDFNLRRWWSKIWLRTHCKVMIVDEDTAFLGGVNVQHYMSSWDDLHIRLQGKVVRQLLRYFARKYIRSGGKRKNVRKLLHPKLANKVFNIKSKLRFLLHSPLVNTNRSPFRAFFRQAASIAKESINLLTPYYAPDRRFLELIYKARRKGVKVNVIMPYMSDLRLMHYMARAFYGISKKMGVSFYFLKKMNHGKAITVDDKLAMIGSANLTSRSFSINHEAGVVFSDADMVNELNGILDNWKNESDPQLEMDMKKGGLVNRAKSWWAMRLKDYV